MTNDKPIRVGFVMHAMQVAGAEVLVAETIRRLGDRIEPTVFCLDSVGPLGEQLRGEGVPVECLGRRPGRDWGVAARLARQVRERDVSVVHAHQYSPFFYAALARVVNRFSPKLIFTEHGRHYPDVVSPLRRSVNRVLFDPLADAVNAVCGFSVGALNRKDGFAGGRICVIENGIELSRYPAEPDRHAVRKRLGFDPDRRYLITVARFHPVKDHATLLRGFAVAADRFPDLDLLLAGDGPLRGELERLTAELNLTDRVTFLGVRRDVPQLLQAADVFAMTSVSEAASLTVMEAMASSLPVVVTAVGGNPEIVRDGTDGLLVPRGDHRAVGGAIVRILSDPDSAAEMGRNARRRVEERYNLDRTVGRYYQLYRDLVGAN